MLLDYEAVYGHIHRIAVSNRASPCTRQPVPSRKQEGRKEYSELEKHLDFHH